MAVQDQSFKTLIRDLIDDVGQLIRQELRLAQAEASEKMTRAQHGVTSMLVGVLLGFCALLILLQALVVALSNVVEPWLAAVIVGVGTAIVAFILFRTGESRLKPENLTPERTMRSVRRDSELVTGRAP